MACAGRRIQQDRRAFRPPIFYFRVTGTESRYLPRRPCNAFESAVPAAFTAVFVLETPAFTAWFAARLPAATAFCTVVFRAPTAVDTALSADAAPAGPPSNKPHAINPAPVTFAKRRGDCFLCIPIATSLSPAVVGLSGVC